jgi:hypothetical protein
MCRVPEAQDAWIDRTLVFCDLEHELGRPLRCGSPAAFAVVAAAHHEAVGDYAKAWTGRPGCLIENAEVATKVPLYCIQAFLVKQLLGNGRRFSGQIGWCSTAWAVEQRGPAEASLCGSRQLALEQEPPAPPWAMATSQRPCERETGRWSVCEGAVGMATLGMERGR